MQNEKCKVRSAKRRSIGAMVRARREEREMTLTRLAGRVGCSKGYLSGIENGIYPRPPSARIVRKLEVALRMKKGALGELADWERTPAGVKKKIADCGLRIGEWGEGKRGEMGARAVSPHPNPLPRGEGTGQSAIRNPQSVMALRRIPVINRIAAGGPAGFTDLDYPVDVADEYVVAPVSEGDAQGLFAARVVGESMLPEYREGEMVVFSGSRDVKDGTDCFVRLEPDHESTFKRVFFEGDGSLRLVAINRAFGERVVEREQVSGLWAAVAVVRNIG